MKVSGVIVVLAWFIESVSIVSSQYLADVFHNVGSNATVEYNITSSTKWSLYFNGSISTRLICSYNYNLGGFIYTVSDVGCSFIRSYQRLAFLILEINASYAGNYTVVTDNYVGICTVYVMDKPTTPSLIPTGQAIESHDVTIKANASSTSSPGEQPLNYTWLINGSKFFPSSRFHSSDNNLTIRALDRSDSSYRIQCYVKERNGLTSDMGIIFLNVLYGPGNSITISPNTVNIYENETIPELVCTATCNPPCSFTWTGPYVYNNGAVLNLGVAQRNKRGQYNCTAMIQTQEKNQLSATKTIEVNINYPATLEGLQIAGGNIHTENNRVNISCFADAFPIPSLTLNQDGQRITSMTSLSLSYDIPSANCTHSGNYTCSVSNTYNSIAVSESTFLRIKCSPKLHQDSSYQNITVTSWRAYLLTATFLAFPRPQIRWYHVRIGNILITDNITTAESRDSLYITDLKNLFSEEEDFGMYFVEASNSVGASTARKTFNVIPRRRPNAPSEFRVNCRPNGVANLTWTSSFNGGLQQYFTVLFKKDGHARFTSQEQRFQDLGLNQFHSYNVIDLTSGVEYQFRIKATNTAGSTQTLSAVCKISAESNSTFGGIYAAGFGSAIGLVVLVAVGIFLFIKIRKGAARRTQTGEDSIGKENNYDSLYANTKEESSYDGLAKSKRKVAGDQTADNHIYQNQDSLKKKPKKDRKREAKKEMKKGDGSAEKHDVLIYQNSEFTGESEEKITTVRDQTVQSTSTVADEERRCNKEQTSSLNDYLQHKNYNQALTEMKLKQVNLGKKDVSRKDEKKTVQKGKL